MYTFWKRTVPPPSLQTFDAPEREFCMVRRSTTNTPLQALVLMNDPTYVEASRKPAERMMKEAGPTAEERIAFAFRQVLARAPRAQETEGMKELFEKQRSVFPQHTAAAPKLLAVAQPPPDARLDTRDAEGRPAGGQGAGGSDDGEGGGGPGGGTESRRRRSSGSRVCKPGRSEIRSWRIA